MVNLYKLTNLLESGMTIFQLNQWKNEGIWYPITQYKKPSNEIEVVTNLFIPIDTETQRYHIQLTANYDASEMDEWKRFLEDNQEKAYQEIVDMVEDEYGDEETNTHFKSIEDIENYFDIVSIETQELTSIGFKTAITYQ